MRSLVALTTLFTLAILCGCGASVPTEDAAKQAVREWITKFDQNRLKLLSFHKTNGQAREENGVKFYNLEYEGEVEVTEDCLRLNFESPIVGELKDIVMEANAFGGKRTVIPHDPQAVLKKGLRRKILGDVSFKKTEKGWISGASEPRMDKPW